MLDILYLLRKLCTSRVGGTWRIEGKTGSSRRTAPPPEARPRSGAPESPGFDPLDFHGTRLRSAPGARFYALVGGDARDTRGPVAGAEMKRMCGLELARRMVRVRPDDRVRLMRATLRDPRRPHRADERGYAGLARHAF